MPIPSLYLSKDVARPWSVARAAAYGAGIGAFAALFKAFGPPHAAGPLAITFLQIAGATLAFALLCAGAAALRNLIAQRLIWRR
jgi:hypothetical protein